MKLLKQFSLLSKRLLNTPLIHKVQLLYKSLSRLFQLMDLEFKMAYLLLMRQTEASKSFQL